MIKEEKCEMIMGELKQRIHYSGHPNIGAAISIRHHILNNKLSTYAQNAAKNQWQPE